MEQRKLGSLSVSVVGLGCNNFGIRLDQARTTQVVDAALGAGINFFDTADVYGGTHSEEFKYAPGKPHPTGTRLTEPNSRGAARFLSDDKLARAAELNEFARKRGHTLLELAFSWLRSHKVVSSIIAGATSAEQIHANAGAIGWQLSADELGEIDRIAPAR